MWQVEEGVARPVAIEDIAQLLPMKPMKLMAWPGAKFRAQSFTVMLVKNGEGRARAQLDPSARARLTNTPRVRCRVWCLRAA